MNFRAYFVKMALRGISPMIWRRFCIPGQTSLAQLHQVIQTAYSWDDEYLHQFHIYGKDYGISYAGGLCFSDDASRVYLDNFEFDVGDKFSYEYNFFDHWIIDIRIENIKVSEDAYVLGCLKGNGMFGVDTDDETKLILKLFNVIRKADDTTTVTDIVPYINAIKALRFNVERINEELAEQII